MIGSRDDGKMAVPSSLKYKIREIYNKIKRNIRYKLKALTLL